MSDLKTDSYYTIEKPAEGLFRDKGSKFIAYAIPVKSLDIIQEELAKLKKLHPKSRHVCYSYRLGIGKDSYRINDDGEPSGSAGLPIYHTILSHQLSDILVAVVRYFGGTKLGIPGLIHAYKTSSEEAISSAGRKEVVLTRRTILHCPMAEIGRLYNVIKQLDLVVLATKYTEQTVSLTIAIRIAAFQDTLIDIIANFEHIDQVAVLTDWSNTTLKIEALSSE
jgi:uncharacterized YigZ family protein